MDGKKLFIGTNVCGGRGYSNGATKPAEHGLLEESTVIRNVCWRQKCFENHLRTALMLMGSFIVPLKIWEHFVRVLTVKLRDERTE